MNPFNLIRWRYVFLLAGLAFGGCTVSDYSLRCMKCLDEKHMGEGRLFGILVSRRISHRFPAEDYEGVFGHPCEHVYRKSGLNEHGRPLFVALLNSGYSICGTSREGVVIRPRTRLLYLVYDTERRLHDPRLARETFALIDTFMPPDVQMRQREALPESARRTWSILNTFLCRAKTSEQWRAILDSAKKGAEDTSHLPAE